MSPKRSFALPSGPNRRYVSGEPTTLKRRLPRRFPPEFLTDAEVRQLMDACGDGPRGDRNRALLALMYRTGLRVSEALALSPKDVDLNAGTVRVLNGKGDKTGVVGSTPEGRPWWRRGPP